MEKRRKMSNILSVEVPEKQTRDNGEVEKMSETFLHFIKDRSSQI